MSAQLTKDVFSESTIDGIVVGNDNDNNMDATTTASESSKRQRRTYNKGRPPPSSGTKERTDEAILKYIKSSLMESNNLTERMTTTMSTATASAKDKYIREKKRIAVCLDDQAMAREVLDAVDLSLQKWKAALKKLHGMEAHGIRTDHPIFTATRATADLHESAFNAYLARAKAQQDELLAPRVLLVAREASILPVDDDDDDHATRPPLVVTEHHTPPSRTTSILDISNSSTSFRSSNDDGEEKE